MPQQSERCEEEKREKDVDRKRGDNVRIFNVRIHACEVILIEARRRSYIAASRRHLFLQLRKQVKRN